VLTWAERPGTLSPHCPISGGRLPVHTRGADPDEGPPSDRITEILTRRATWNLWSVGRVP
jgi:hypothetical protein